MKKYGLFLLLALIFMLSGCMNSSSNSSSNSVNTDEKNEEDEIYKITKDEYKNAFLFEYDNFVSKTYSNKELYYLEECYNGIVKKIDYNPVHIIGEETKPITKYYELKGSLFNNNMIDFFYYVYDYLKYDENKKEYLANNVDYSNNVISIKIKFLNDKINLIYYANNNSLYP